MRILESAGPLNPSDRKIPDGLRLHALDIWTTELFGALTTMQDENDVSEDKDTTSEQRSEDTKVQLPVVVPTGLGKRINRSTVLQHWAMSIYLCSQGVNTIKEVSSGQLIRGSRRGLFGRTLELFSSCAAGDLIVRVIGW